ncbi:MAG: SRPBCC domain-containing protein [Bacteriovoracaceae bacterium]
MDKAVVSRFFTIPVHELFGYFMDPVLIEKWSAPEGMTLKVKSFDGNEGGKYRYEHTSKDGVFVCNGHFRRIDLNQKLLLVDDEIIAPDGKLLAEKLETEILFTSLGTGSGVEIKVSGFNNREFANDCEKSWNQCLDNLQDIVKDSGIRQFRDESSGLTGKQNQQ